MNTTRRIGEEVSERGDSATPGERKAPDDPNDAGVTAVIGTVATQDSDAELIRRSLQEPEWFGTVFDRYYPQIHAYAARRLGHSNADDVAAHTFLIGFSRRDRYDVTRADARPWLYGIASNLISQQHRAEKRRYQALARMEVDLVSAGHADQVAARVDARSRRGLLATTLARLSRADRDVLLLVVWAELTSEEAGKALGIPAGTARPAGSSRTRRSSRGNRASRPS